jgi:hypothetical protein
VHHAETADQVKILLDRAGAHEDLRPELEAIARTRGFSLGD